MTDSATVEWLDVAPNDDDRRALDSWARARGVTLSLPTTTEVNARAPDPEAAQDVERDLEAARDALAKLDGRWAEVILSHADGVLREHPQLPQGAWLLAEVHRGWAARWSGIEPRSIERAEEESTSARALDGGRAAGVGERTFQSNENPISYTLEAELPEGATLTWDGGSVEAGVHKTLAGVHQLRAVSRGRVVFASWVSVVQDTRIRVSIPGPVACSEADLEGVRASSGTIYARGVRCASWVAVARMGPAGLAFARCERARCGELLLGANGASANMFAPSRAAWKTWKTWAIASGIVTGVVAIIGVALGVGGLFSTGSTATVFASGGPPKPE